LDAITRDRTTGVRNAESSATLNSSEETSSNTTNKRTDKMGMEDLKGVVDASEDCHAAAGDVHGEPGDDTGADTERDCAPSGDETCSGSDGNETRDHALDGADDGGFAEVD
jgi:hypothetical protein